MTSQEDATQQEIERFREAALEGLARAQKSIPARYFYDAHGSHLFDLICELDEYYPTQTELGLLKTYTPEIADWAGEDVALVEFGSGSSVKVRLLLDRLRNPAAYVPVDISREHLLAASDALAADYPSLTVVPVAADFTLPFPVPDDVPGRRVGFFPGSTIGNFEPPHAQELLASFASVIGAGGSMIIGVDLKKNPAILSAAYNDKRGVTAAFNMNLLTRANRELRADFDLGQFEHHAFYNEAFGRIEMHLRSLRAQSVTIAGQSFAFAAGETIHTENSYKYAVEEFETLVAGCGWNRRKTWIDDAGLFSVHYLDQVG